MKKSVLLSCILFFSVLYSYAQQVLPSITVQNLNEKIIVSWRNEYTVPVTNISIQRSYDSSKNYTTIGSVLNPLNKENGYADANPPYNKMYYRLFISFEGGAYILTQPVRPSKNPDFGTSSGTPVDPLLDSSLQVPPPPPPAGTNPAISFPSKRIFTSKDNNVIIHLPDASLRKYSIKFFDELEKLVFELPRIKDDYLVVEKVNFVKAGWYRFEIYDNEQVIEKNRFYIARDLKGYISPGLESIQRVPNR